ncbi:hypothetical protein CE665_23430 [Salmonella enterica subsp. enterica serovar Poona]|nr:hypothetical protein [Salmonella enterica subsp. enterica serovar Poona]
MILYGFCANVTSGIRVYNRQNIFPVRKDADVIPDELLDKLIPDNNAGEGSTSGQGYVVNTQSGARKILDVVNTYMTNKLTADELALILKYRDRFTFTAGVGDRRRDFISRFAFVTNWHGEDVNNLLLAPDPWNDPHYNFRLTFSADAGTMTLTDSHANTPSTYGALRYFTIRQK